VVTILRRMKRFSHDEEPSARYFAYARLMNYLRTEIQDGADGFGPLWAATVRELRNYPEFADLTVLYLEEVTVTGTNKFDRVMEQELRETETFLLGLKND